MLAHLLFGRVGRRRATCRGAHEWTYMAMPPACIHCGRSKVC